MPGDRYRRGAHTVLELKYHYAWKTKYSYKVLRGDVGLKLCATVGVVTEKQIQDYIENQTDEDGTFEVWDESKEGDDDQSDDEA